MMTLIVCCAVLGAACGAFTPRIAHRLAVEPGRPPRSCCLHCGRPFPPGLPGWVRAGRSCPAPTRRPRPTAGSAELRPPTRRPPPVPTSVGSGGGGQAWLALGAGALAAGALGAACGPAPELFAFLAAVALGLPLAMIDVACLRLPNLLVAALLAAIVGPLTIGALILGEPGRLPRAVVAGALCGAGHLLIPRLGLGDVKLAAVLGTLLGWLGWPAAVLGTLLPHLLNGPVALYLLVTRRAGRRTALPFGPALLTGALLAVLLT